MATSFNVLMASSVNLVGNEGLALDIVALAGHCIPTKGVACDRAFYHRLSQSRKIIMFDAVSDVGEGSVHT